MISPIELGLTENVNRPLPTVNLRSSRYFSDGSFRPTETDLSEMERSAMAVCHELGEKALMRRNPPIGAVLINDETGDLFGASTVDKKRPGLLGHAEVRAYERAKRYVGDWLGRCTLVTSVQPCTTCTAPYAEGKIGKIVYAAPRSAVFAVAGLMRPRAINMHELLVDGATDTVVTEGFDAARTLANFALWAELKAAGKVNG